MSEQKGTIFGIDLGTTYSCIAYVDEFGKPVIIKSSEGQATTTPSVVYFENPTNIVVGQQAKNAAPLEPDRVVQEVKRQMGDPYYLFEADGKQYRPEQISSFILRRLADDAGNFLNQEVKDVVITCPAYFGQNEVEATKAAGELAGLNVKLVLREPVAAAIAYSSIESIEDQTALVFDLGGGTFDVSIVNITKDTKTVLTGGDQKLGGMDWDEDLGIYIAGCFEQEHPDLGNPFEDQETGKEILIKAEEIKKSLSSLETAKYSPSLQYKGGKSKIEVTREKFEEITQPHLDRCMELTKNLLTLARKKGYDKIDQILLVGGSCRMPMVKRALVEAFGLPLRLYDPDEAVAKGAAIKGLELMVKKEVTDEVIKILNLSPEEGVDLREIGEEQIKTATEAVAEKKETGPLSLLTREQIEEMAKKETGIVCSKGFGVKAYNNEKDDFEVVYLIHMNTKLPTEVTKEFGTKEENQDSVHVEVYEQNDQEVESENLEANTKVSEGEVKDLPPGLPKGSPINVTFKLNEEGRLQVSALEPSSGKDCNFEAKITSVMSKEEIEEKRKEMSGLIVKAG